MTKFVLVKEELWESHDETSGKSVWRNSRMWNKYFQNSIWFCDRKTNKEINLFVKTTNIRNIEKRRNEEAYDKV